jgi:hypothetical protein
MFVRAKMYFRSLEMKWIPKYLLLCLILQAFLKVNAQTTLVKGYVLSIDSNQLVPLANILNKTSGKRFIGSRQGIFKATVAPTDSITITAIGYESLYFLASDIIPDNPQDTIKIFMRPTSYQLKDVTFIYSNRARDSIAMAAAEFLKTDPLMNNYDRVLNRNQGGLMSPLTAMYMEYSKAGQDMKHFEEFVQHAEMLKQVNMRYNKKTIKRATGLDDEYLDDYIIYCNLEKAFILNSSDYELILAMRKCADRFKAAKGID